MFLVARDQPDLWDQLNKEFSGKDVSIVVDRRRAERRRGPEANEAERRRSDRRGREEVDLEVRSRGFSVIRVAPDGPARREGNPTAVRVVQGYMQERFRHFTTVMSWDARQNALAFVIFNRAGHPAHRVLFDREFLDYYGASMPDRIPSTLDEWKLSSHLETVGSQPVTVSTYGISTR